MPEEEQQLHFPKFGETYVKVTIETANMELFQCVNCGTNRRDEDCIRNQQRACAQMGWNLGWCAAKKTESEGV